MPLRSKRKAVQPGTSSRVAAQLSLPRHPGVRWLCCGANSRRDAAQPTSPSVRVHHGMLVPSNDVGPTAAVVLAEVAPHYAAAWLEAVQGPIRLTRIARAA